MLVKDKISSKRSHIDKKKTQNGVFFLYKDDASVKSSQRQKSAISCCIFWS